MQGLEFILVFLAVATALLPLAQRIDVPFPIVLVLGGLALAFLPGLPQVSLDPDVSFLIFVPPLLYRAALTTSLRDLRRDLRPIGLLAVGAVLVTTAAVAVVAHTIIPGLPWAAAVVLGAIIAPPDAAVATAVAKRLGVPRRIVTVLEGETLLNDTTAFVTYRTAVAAVVTGSFSLLAASGRLVVLSLGGVAVGFVLAKVIAWLRSHVRDTISGNTISLLTPFAAYLPAEALGLSGVLAVVTVGLLLGRDAAARTPPRMRMQSQGMWEVLEFVLDALIFLLIGLELGRNVRRESLHGGCGLVGLAALISLVVIVARIAWVFATTYLPRLWRRPSPDAPPASWRAVALVAWTGMRGGDSLVTALALPHTVHGGGEFPARSTLVAISFGVIVSTLVLQGLTLRPLVRWLALPADTTDRLEEVSARRKAAEAGLARLDELCARAVLPAVMIERLRAHFQMLSRQDLADLEESADGEPTKVADAFRAIEAEVLDAQRKAVIALRDEGVISDHVLRVVQRDLDLETMRIEESNEPVD